MPSQAQWPFSLAQTYSTAQLRLMPTMLQHCAAADEDVMLPQLSAHEMLALKVHGKWDQVPQTSPELRC